VAQSETPSGVEMDGTEQGEMRAVKEVERGLGKWGMNEWLGLGGQSRGGFSGPHLGRPFYWAMAVPAPL
jgi:hypothetical protein